VINARIRHPIGGRHTGRVDLSELPDLPVRAVLTEVADTLAEHGAAVLSRHPAPARPPWSRSPWLA
jgi:hypothetical protein